MQYLCKYIEHQDDATKSRKGGLLLRGATRTERQPIHLLFVLDTSGSMEENDKLIHVKRSISFLLPYLTSADQLSLVTFSGQATTHLTCTPVTPENKCAIEYKIAQIEPQESTNLAGGLLAVTPILQTAAAAAAEQPSRKQGVIVLTDGYVNDGIRDEPTLLELVKSRLQMFPGLSISCIAYGQQHNADLLSKIAIEGGGSYNIVQNLEDVASVFGEILGGLLSISAQMVTVTLPPGTTSDAPFPKETMPDGSTVIRIGDMYAESEQVILFESVPSAAALRVTGVTLPTFAPFQDEQFPESLPAAAVPEPAFVLAEIRQEVGRLLKQFRTPTHNPTDLTTQATALRTRIASSSFHETPLAAMMMEDLNLILQGAAAARHELASQTIQHETYLSVARGLRTPSRPTGHTGVPPRLPHRAMGARCIRPEDEEADEVSENPSATFSMFSNTVQRNLTSALRTVSQQPAAAAAVQPMDVLPVTPIPLPPPQPASQTPQTPSQ